jgi:pre-60S factor REI1
MSDSHMFTCISCAVAFNDPAMQRSHFASDWHRYNMKVSYNRLPRTSSVFREAELTDGMCLMYQWRW